MSNRLKLLLSGVGLLLALVVAALLWRPAPEPSPNPSQPRPEDRGLMTARNPQSGSQTPSSTTRTVPERAVQPLPPTSEILKRVLAKYREACRTIPKLHMTRMQREFFFGLREARFACLIDPATCERVALELIQPGKEDPESSKLGLDLLGYLTKQGVKGAGSALAASATTGDPELQEHALRALYSGDDQGIYQSLYLRKASQGNQVAIRMIGTWSDPQALPILRDLVEQNPSIVAPACNVRLGAEAAIEREEIIDSPRSAERIAEILTGQNHDDFRFIDWAIRVAQVRPPQNLASICRARLNAGELKALEIEAAGMSSQMMKPGHTEVQFLSAPHVQETDDNHFDDILLLMASSGGELSNMEQRRLRFLGYAGDPKTRLAELLSEDK